MGETLQAVKHYQRVLERSSHDEKRMIRCIEKLYQLPVTVQLLQDTGVGRTVNALRKGEGDVASAARTVIAKWKQMVSDEEERLENAERAENLRNSHSPAQNEDSSPYSAERVSETTYKSSSMKHDKYRKSESGTSRMKDEYKKSSDKYNEDNVHHRDHKNNSSHSKKRQHDSEISHKNAKSQKLASSSSENENDSNDENEEEENESDEDNGQIERQKSESDEHEYANERSAHKISSDESEQETPSSKTSYKSKNSSLTDSVKTKSKHLHNTDESDRHRHRHKSDSNDSSRHNSNHSKSSSRDREKSKSKSKHSYSSQVEDLHLKYERIRQAEKNELSDENKHNSKGHSSDTNNVEKSSHSRSKSKHSSTKEEHSNHSLKSNKESSKHHSHKSKHGDKEKSETEKSKKSSKHKDSYDKNSSYDDSNVKKDSRSSSESKRKDSKSDRHKEKHNSSKDSSSSKTNSKSKVKELSESTSETKKKKTYEHGESIDGGSGASFAEALGMISPSKSNSSIKKKSSSSSKTLAESQGETSSKKHFDESTPALLQSSSKLTPLPSLTVSVSALPDISPNYVPRPPPKLIESPFPPISEEEALTVVMNSKNQRTKVFSGNKSAHGHIPTLYELCVFILQEHINDLEYTGGIPYEIIKPIVDKASPEQLFTLEHYNPYLIEDTDPLWQLHCSRRFRNKSRQELESWRDMYMRCCDEQEAKLKSLTANIKLSQDKSQPVRTTKMAYVDSIVKPPRNIARKQALHGTARKPVASPAARVASLANSTVFNASSAVGVGTSSSTAPVRTSSFVKPKKAPLMQKALQLIKGRYKR